MSLHLPPLRLTGARVLRNGQLQRRSLCIARGKITKGPLPEVDLSDYLVLPGIVDLHFDALGLLRTQELPAIKTRLASEGVTTAWLSVPSDPVPLIGQVLSALASVRGGIDLRAKLMLAPDARLTPDHLSSLEEQRLDFASFQSIAQKSSDRSSAPDFPREMCRMAECFDSLGIVYGSFGDADAETREYYRMLGARIAERPRSRAAAATARAMGDPVIAAASDLGVTAPIGDAISTTRLTSEGLCDCLMSNGTAGAMAEAAWILANGQADNLATTWDLISRRPAEIIGLSDRGVLDYGKRADLVIVHAGTRKVAATIAKGRLCFAVKDVAARFGHSGHELPMAAE
jgi:alpha-D-ribose 1-methylphosphonate 5-triphosphate diphosphatase